MIIWFNYNASWEQGLILLDLTSKTDLLMLSDEGPELSQQQTDTMFQEPSLDKQAGELIIGTVYECQCEGAVV